ncbi:MAG TPA: geranylgeranyl reductase family protein [Acidimicrobiales bacterium]|nr:geranylgeranyl reductase family protein [Acidimicrobiales bacterium]
MQVDVAIIGGGPAGSATAITLAKSGRSVAVFDKATFPRDKCCGDGLTTLALRLGENLGLVPSKIREWKNVDEATLHWEGGRSVSCALPSGSGLYAAVVPRLYYDQALLDIAQTHGASVYQGHALKSITVESEKATMFIEGLGVVEANNVVAADGMWSPTRRFLGLSKDNYRGEWHAFRQYFKNVGPKTDNLHIWFEPDLLPGYVWSFPLSERRANVGFGILRGGQIPISEMGKIWKELLERPNIKDVLGDRFEPEGRHTAWPIPARVTSMPLSHGPVLFVGDAAAAADTLTGEGIGQALLTGILAGEALLEEKHVTEIAKRYEESVSQELSSDHKMSLVLQKILSRPKVTRYALGIATSTKWARNNFVRWMFEDYPRALLFTPKRWKTGIFKRLGAYKDRVEP